LRGAVHKMVGVPLRFILSLTPVSGENEIWCLLSIDALSITSGPIEVLDETVFSVGVTAQCLFPAVVGGRAVWGIMLVVGE
jgi:hypothetical protein